MRLYNSSAILITYNPKKDTAVLEWKASTSGWTEREFKHECYEIARAVQKCKPRFLLSLNKGLHFTINLELRDWIVRHIFSEHRKNGVNKMAILTHPEEIAPSQEELWKNSEIETSTFDSLVEAEDWLYASQVSLA